jgi:phage head maturation protease
MTQGREQIAEFTTAQEALEAMRASGVEVISDERGDRVVTAPDVEVRDISSKDKSLTVVFSTSRYCERDGCILESKGVNLKNFKRNPVVLWMHNYNELPIATSKSVRFENADGGRLIGKPVFHGRTPLSAEVWALIELGVLQAWSLGFIPTHVQRLSPKEVGLKVPSEEDKDKYIEGEGVLDLRYLDTYWRIKKAELLEYSSVTVPADANALSKSIRTLHEGGRSVPTIEKMLRESGIEIPELVPAEIKVGKEDIEEIVAEEIAAEMSRLAEDAEREEDMPNVDETREDGILTLRSSLEEHEYSVEIAIGDNVRAEYAFDEEGGILAWRYHFDTSDFDWDADGAALWMEERSKALEDWVCKLRGTGLDLGCFRFEECEGFIPVPIDDTAFRAGKVISKKTAEKLDGVVKALDSVTKSATEAANLIEDVLRATEDKKEEEQEESAGDGKSAESEPLVKAAPVKTKQKPTTGDALKGFVVDIVKGAVSKKD